MADGALVPAAASRVEACAACNALETREPVLRARILQQGDGAGIHIEDVVILRATDRPSGRADTLHVRRAVVGGERRRSLVVVAFRHTHGRVPAIEVAELLEVGYIVVVGMVVADLLAQVLGEPALAADTLDGVLMTAGHRDGALARSVLHRHLLTAGGHRTVAIVVERPRDPVVAHAERVKAAEVVAHVRMRVGGRQRGRTVEIRLGEDHISSAFRQLDSHLARTSEAVGNRGHLEEARLRDDGVVTRHVFTVVGHRVVADDVLALAQAELRAGRGGGHHIGGSDTIYRIARSTQRSAIIDLGGIVGGDRQFADCNGKFHVELRRVIALGATDIESTLNSGQGHHVVERTSFTKVIAHMVGFGLQLTGSEVIAFHQTGDRPRTCHAVAQVVGNHHREFRTVVNLAVNELDIEVTRFEFHRTGGDGLLANVGIIHIHTTIRNRIGEAVVMVRVVGIGHIGHARECRGHRQFVTSGQREHQAVGAGIGVDHHTVVGHLVLFELIAVGRAVIGDRRGLTLIEGWRQNVGAGRRDGDGSVAANDTELSQSGVYGVVGRDEDIRHRGVLNGVVFAGADIRHRTCGVDVGHLTVQEAVARNRVVRVGQRRAVKLFGVRCRGDMDDTRRNLQRAVLRRHIELGRHIVACGILHHRRAGDGVRQVADIRTTRVGSRQTAHRVGVAINGELERLEARHTLDRAVIHIAGAAVGHHRNRIRGRTVGDGQLARRLRAQSVVGRHIGAAAHHLEGVGGVRTIVVRRLGSQRAVGRRVGDARRLAVHHIAERVFGVTELLGTVVLYRLVRHGDRDSARGDLQRAVGLVHRELGRHVVVVGVLHHRRATDGVRQAADIRAARVACRQTAHRVGVALHREGRRHKARRTHFSAVVNVASIAIGHHSNLVLVRTVGNGQLAGRCRCQVVVRSHIVVRSILHHQVIAEATRVGAGQRTLGRCVGDGGRLAVHHIAERVGSDTRMRVAVIHHGIGIGDCDRNRTRGDLERVLAIVRVVVVCGSAHIDLLRADRGE